MTPKEKAEELVYKLVDSIDDNVLIETHDVVKWRKTFKQCALIAVDEILKCDPLSPSKLTGKKTSVETYKEWEFEAFEYWQQVKNEIELL